jgi:hypothetical protein
MKAREISRESNVPLKTVQAGIDAARQREGSRPTQDMSPRYPRLEPLMPVLYLTPQSTCPHKGTIRKGSIFCCMVCHQSGKDHYRAMQRIPALDPKPDKKPKPKAKPQSRREKRSLARVADR